MEPTLAATRSQLNSKSKIFFQQSIPDVYRHPFPRHSSPASESEEKEPPLDVVAFIFLLGTTSLQGRHCPFHH